MCPLLEDTYAGLTKLFMVILNLHTLTLFLVYANSIRCHTVIDYMNWLPANVIHVIHCSN